MKKILFLLFISITAVAQTNWYLGNTDTLNYTPTDTIYRTGPVAISHGFKTTYNNKLLVTDKYNTVNNRAAYFSLNEPASEDIGLATIDTAESHNSLVASHYLNFESGKTFTDVHTSTAEFSLVRGMNDTLGFADGGHLNKTAVVKLSGRFEDNQRAYSNTDFDLINLRFFTSSTPGQLASITNFYGIRLEPFRGVNAGMITNGWGVSIEPTFLKNHFGGMVGIGTKTVTNPLTINAAANPIKATGVLSSNTDNFQLTIDDSGVFHKKLIKEDFADFATNTSSISLTDTVKLYIHKGADVVYSLPPASSRSGKIWKIVNLGTGTITFNIGYKEGNEIRTTLSNNAGDYTLELFSDGVDYIKL